MNPLANKQSMLKLALFAALAANLSYGPIKTQMNSLELMQVEGDTAEQRAEDAAKARQAQVAAAARSSRGAAITSKPAAASASRTTPPPAASRSEITPVVSRPVTRPAPALQKPKPVETTTATRTTSVAIPEVRMSSGADRIVLCKGTEAEREQRVAFRYADNFTYIEPVESDCKDCYVRIKQADTNEVRTNALMPALREALEKVGCEKEVAAQTEEEKREEEKRRRKIEQKIARCELKKVGPKKADGSFETEEMEKGSEERIECNKERLQNVADELEKETGKEPKKADIQARIDQIMNRELKGEVKRLLTSHDEDEREEGRELARELRSEIEDLREEYEIRGTDKWGRKLHAFEVGGKLMSDLYSFEEPLDGTRERAQELSMEIQMAKSQGQRNFSAEMQLNQLQQQMKMTAAQIDQTIYYPLMNMQSALGEDMPSFMDPFNVFKTQFVSSWSTDPVTGQIRINNDPGTPGNSSVLPEGINPQRSASSVHYRGIANLPVSAPQLDLRTGGESRFSMSSALNSGSSDLGRLRN